MGADCLISPCAQGACSKITVLFLFFLCVRPRRRCSSASARRRWRAELHHTRRGPTPGCGFLCAVATIASSKVVDRPRRRHAPATRPRHTHAGTKLQSPRRGDAPRACGLVVARQPSSSGKSKRRLGTREQPTTAKDNRNARGVGARNRGEGMRTRLARTARTGRRAAAGRRPRRPHYHHPPRPGPCPAHLSRSLRAWPLPRRWRRRCPCLERAVTLV